jgi:hypothetical protein
MLDKQQAKAFKALLEFYCGFFIEDPVGNNAFSFEQRKNKRIFVPPLKSGGLEDVCVGKETVFSEIFNGEEKNVCGLEQFVYWKRKSQQVFIFDNHNHAFAFWAFGVAAGFFSPGLVLVHVDQHKDTRIPERLLEKSFWQQRTLSEVCDYTNFELNVGNFIPPAREAGIFSDVICVDAESALEVVLPNGCVADIDLDFFSPQMDYIPFAKKIEYVRELIQRSHFVTVATSPYFIDQDLALMALKKIFE